MTNSRLIQILEEVRRILGQDLDQAQEKAAESHKSSTAHAKKIVKDLVAKGKKDRTAATKIVATRGKPSVSSK